MLRSLLAKYLRKSAAVVTEAANKAEALEAYGQAADAFDVVVTDVHLPDGSGLDLAVSIRDVREAQPIVFVTGDVSESLARAALEHERAGYLLKPFEFFELDAAISQALGSALKAPAEPSVMPRDQAWLLRQRTLLESAAQRPVELRLVERRVSRFDFHFIRRAALAVIVLLLIAWAVGYLTGPDEPPAAPVRQEAPAPAPATPPPTPPPSDSR